jgi:hypothetical protein
MKISSRSTRRVLRLLKPPTARTGMDNPAPRGLTVRALCHHKARAKLRNSGATILAIEGGHLLCLHNLLTLGFDIYG